MTKIWSSQSYLIKVCRAENWAGLLSSHTYNWTTVSRKRLKPLPAHSVAPGSARVQCCAPVKYLHGVDGDGESRVIPVHLVLLGALVPHGAMLMGRAEPEHAQCYHQHQDTHTDDDNNSGHAGNHWDKGWQRECSYTCGTSHLNPTNLISFQPTVPPPLDWESGQTPAMCLGWQKVLTSAHPLRWSTHKWCSQISYPEYDKS